MRDRLPAGKSSSAGYLPTSVAQRSFRPGAGAPAGKTNGSAHGNNKSTPLGKKLMSSSQPAVSEVALDASLSGVSPPPRPSTSMGLHTGRDASHDMTPDFPDDSTQTRSSTPRLTLADSGSRPFKIKNNGQRQIMNAKSPQMSAHQQRRMGPSSKLAPQLNVGSPSHPMSDQAMEDRPLLANGSNPSVELQEFGLQCSQPHGAPKKRNRQSDTEQRAVKAKVEKVSFSAKDSEQFSLSFVPAALNEANADADAPNMDDCAKIRISGKSSTAPADGGYVESKSIDAIDAKARHSRQRYLHPVNLATRGVAAIETQNHMQRDFDNGKSAFAPHDTSTTALDYEQPAIMADSRKRGGQYEEYAVMSDQSEDDDERPAVSQHTQNSFQTAPDPQGHRLAQQTSKVGEQQHCERLATLHTNGNETAAHAGEMSEEDGFWFSDDDAGSVRDSALGPTVEVKLHNADSVRPSQVHASAITQNPHLVGSKVGVPKNGGRFAQSTPQRTQNQTQREDDQTLVEEADPAPDDEQTAHDLTYDTEKAPEEFAPHPDCRCNSCFIPTGESRDKYHTQTLDEWLSQGDEYTSRLPILFKKILDVMKARVGQVDSLHTKFSDQILAVEKQQSAIESQRGKIKAWKTGSFLGLAGSLATCAGVEGGSAASTPVRASSV